MINKTLLLLVFFSSIMPFLRAQHISIADDTNAKQVVFSNTKMQVRLNYDQQANLSFLTVNGQELINGQKGIFSEIRLNDTSYSTLHLAKSPAVKIANNTIILSDIQYGGPNLSIREHWTFTLSDSAIKLSIQRTVPRDIEVAQLLSPAILFHNINVWDGAFQDYGGLAWFYLFNQKLDTYGTHSRSAKFWNSKTGNGLNVVIDAPGKEVATIYSRTANDELLWSAAEASQNILPRYDSGTNRRRYLRGLGTNVWAPIKINAGTSEQTITISYYDFKEEYDRGNFVGLNGVQISDVLNTIARIGVIDKNHFGGNSWHTPYGPICLHEQYIGQMGLAINDPAYLKGYQQCLDFYRDNAIKPDGRVYSRWAYTNEDAMPGVFNEKGFYEAQWGYLLDANPDFVTNVSELFDQTGDKSWIKTHQLSCEKALDWLLERDRDHDGLVEMMNDSMQQKKSSDWIDIIWASYENAFVNAKLYHALVLWANIEKQLGNMERSKYYASFAQQLKSSFNKRTQDGGFWDEENQCYVHWRDKNGSIHGRNMVTPVNFMAIGYGICDDSLRIRAILDGIETKMEQEQLFFWPLCMTSYAAGEGQDWQYPFPNYENGDIFLSWGALGVKVYAAYKPEIALKYVRNVLDRYAKDGLAFQRYGRLKQEGLGDDILSGNCLSVVGLYQAIYGINPLHNRLYLDPHITDELAGTSIKYNYRDQKLKIDLAVDRYTISNRQFKITGNKAFGSFFSKNELTYFHDGNENASMKILADNKLGIKLKSWNMEAYSWSQSGQSETKKKVTYQLMQLKPNSYYTVHVNKALFRKIKTSGEGMLIFSINQSQGEDEITVSGQ